MEVNRTINRLQEYAKRIRKLTQKRINVGFFSESRYDDNLPVAQVAEWQEFGSTKAPARPFMRPAFNNNLDKWKDAMARGAKAVSENRIEPEDVLNQIGFLAQADVQQAIVDVTQPELSPVTLLLRQWKKEGQTITGRLVWKAIAEVKKGAQAQGVSTKPLQDTGTMLASVQYKLKKK